MVSKLLGQAACPFGSSCKKDHSRHGPIQTVQKPDEDVPGLGVFFPEVVPHLVQQGWLPAMVRLDQNTRPLVDGNEVVILIEHLQFCRLLHGLCYTTSPMPRPRAPYRPGRQPAAEAP